MGVPPFHYPDPGGGHDQKFDLKSGWWRINAQDCGGVADSTGQNDIYACCFYTIRQKPPVRRWGEETALILVLDGIGHEMTSRSKSVGVVVLKKRKKIQIAWG